MKKIILIVSTLLMGCYYNLGNGDDILMNIEIDYGSTDVLHINKNDTITLVVHHLKTAINYSLSKSDTLQLKFNTNPDWSLMKITVDGEVIYNWAKQNHVFKYP